MKWLYLEKKKNFQENIRTKSATECNEKATVQTLIEELLVAYLIQGQPV